MRNYFPVLASVCLAIFLGGKAQDVRGQGSATALIQLPAGELKWQPFAPGVAVDVAPLWGDRSKPGDYGMFLRLRAGQSAGMHAHSNDYHGVNVKGVWIRTIQGNPVPTRLPVGSYVFQPKMQFHDDKCEGPEDCILLIHQNSPADVLMPPK